jgi:hypothetical protein
LTAAAAAEADSIDGAGVAVAAVAEELGTAVVAAPGSLRFG